MKTICCVSDCHLGYMHRQKKERLEDYEKAFTEAVEKALKYEPCLIIFGGDLTEHTRPDPRSLKILIKTLMSAAEKAKVVVCVGNHEIEGNIRTAYTPMFSELHGNIHVLTADNPHVYLDVGDVKVGVHGFQFLRGKEAAEEALKKVSSEVRKASSEKEKNILCIHQAVEKYLNPFEVSIKALNEASGKYDLILVGHVHKHQRIGEISVPAYYIGSTERVSFNEAENPAGFLVFRDGVFDKPEYVEVTSSSMRRISRDLGTKTADEINQEIKKTIEENKDVKCLQITVEAEIAGDQFEIIHDWETRYPGYKVLSVNVVPRINNKAISIEKAEIDERLFDEYFGKKDLAARKDLKDLCLKFYEQYGRINP